MATTAPAHLTPLNNRQYIEWFNDKIEASDAFVLNAEKTYDYTADNTIGINSTTALLKYFNIGNEFTHQLKKFDQQFSLFKNSYEGLSYGYIKEKLSFSISELINLNPDILSFELTHERSTFFTLKKGDYTFFLQQYFDEIELGDDEAILSVFFKDEKKPSYSGSIQDTIFEISKFIDVDKYKYECAYEISY